MTRSRCWTSDISSEELKEELLVVIMQSVGTVRSRRPRTEILSSRSSETASTASHGLGVQASVREDVKWTFPG